MRIIYFLFFSFVLHLLYSCSEQKEPDRLHELLDKLENEGDSESTLDDLLELTEEMEGTATIIVDSAHFEITFPITNPEESTIIQIIENERIKIYQYKANTQDSEDDNLGYSIDYVFIPELKTEEEIDYLFNEQRDYLISASNAKVEFERVIDLDGTPGRHLYLTIDDSDMKTNCKMYFKNGILYKLAVVTADGKLFNKSIRKFFDSFKILE